MDYFLSEKIYFNQMGRVKGNESNYFSSSFGLNEFENICGNLATNIQKLKRKFQKFLTN